MAMLFLLPALCLLIAVRLIPMAWALKQSVVNGQGEFVGAENFSYIAQSVTIGSMIRATVLFTVLTVLVLTAVSILVAVIFTQTLPLGQLLRALVFVPIAVPLSGSAIFWSVAFRPDGLANSLVTGMGLSEQPFLLSPIQALPSLVVMLVWISVGYGMLFLIAGIQEIPEELYEAAALDGASWRRKTIHITIPSLRRQMLFVVVSNTAGAVAVFAPISMLTRGGPEGSTNLVMWDVFQRAYVSQDMSAAMAEVVVVTALLLAIVTWQFKLLKTA